METRAPVSDYHFAEMGGDDETTPNRAAPAEPSCARQLLVDNLMLIVTLTGVILGILLGFGLRPLRPSADVVMLISYPGELFMRVLKLMILPLIIASLVAGSASLNARMNGKIAMRTLIYFILTSMFNALLGICLVLSIHPGDPGLKNDRAESVRNDRDVKMMDSLLDLGRNVFPDNLFEATFQQSRTTYMSASKLGSKNESDDIIESVELIRIVQSRPGTNTIGIVFFCLVFGTLLGTVGAKGQVVIDFFQAVFEVIMRIVSGIMWFTPIGISSVIAGKILNVEDIGLVMSQLAWFIVTIAIGVFFYQLIVMQLIYFVFVKKNPYKFYWGLIQATLTACATASTAAALPVTFRLMSARLHVDSRVTRFVLPIGCNINMDGTALYVAVASIFISQMNDIKLGFGELCTVFLTSTAASVSSASVPSAALVLLLVVLGSIDVPTQNVSLLFAIDWFVDRIRTTNNMLGDCYAAAVVEQLSKKELMTCDAATLHPILINGLISDQQPDFEGLTMNMKTNSLMAEEIKIDIPHSEDIKCHKSALNET